MRVPEKVQFGRPSQIPLFKKDGSPRLARKNPVQYTKQALCHPDRKAMARGLCTVCYSHQHYLGRFPKRSRRLEKPTCHPERPHKAKGLCRECYAKYDNGKRRERDFIRQYGLTVEQVELKKKEQDNACMICGEKPKRLCVDHDHKTGKARDLLCVPCNIGLGDFKENPLILEKAVQYIRRWNEKGIYSPSLTE